MSNRWRRVIDVAVLGAGLAGLSAAHDLAGAGADVTVLEARAWPGGRVEQVETRDGRLVQLGGEIVGPFHTAYRGLVEELGLTIVPSFVEEEGDTVYDLLEGPVGSPDFRGLLDAADEPDFLRVEGLFGDIVRSVDPDDPWSHPDAARLDGVSVGDWLRGVGARPATYRALELMARGLCTNSVERHSLLALARKEAAAGHFGFYDYDVWESLRVEEGSATVALTLAERLGERVRYGAVVRAVRAGPGGCVVETTTGEQVRAETVVCALPVGVLHDVELDGVDPERVRSLRAQRSVLTAKIAAAYPESVWRAAGHNGHSLGEREIGSLWPQGPAGVLSGLVPPERLGFFLGSSEATRRETVLRGLGRILGAEAAAPDELWLRPWGVDPYTRGYITAWAPGDVMAVGPRHGTHAPPFYVCGSDQWVAGYMEGAVRTGRAAARAALGVPA
jgi:monoamine oxidase